MDAAVALRATGRPSAAVPVPGAGRRHPVLCRFGAATGEDQPIYAFRPRGVDQDLPPHLTMDEMIADYLAAMRELRPTGPYYLAGWSAGGDFAFALAEALERAGEEVALIAMLDTPLPSIFDNVSVDDDTRFLCELVGFASRFSGTDVPIHYEELAKIAPEEQFQSALAKGRANAASFRPKRPNRLFGDWCARGRSECTRIAELQAETRLGADPIVRTGQQIGPGRSFGMHGAHGGRSRMVEPSWSDRRASRGAGRSLHHDGWRRCRIDRAGNWQASCRPRRNQRSEKLSRRRGDDANTSGGATAAEADCPGRLRFGIRKGDDHLGQVARYLTHYSAPRCRG